MRISPAHMFHVRVNSLVTGLILIQAGFLTALGTELKIAPRWAITVVDENNRPVAGTNVYQAWEYYGLSSSKSENLKTNDQGQVTFSARSQTTNVLSYTLSCGATALNVHGSFGPSASISVSKEGYKGALIYYHADTGKTDDAPERCYANVVSKITKEGLAMTVQLIPLDLSDAVRASNLDEVKRRLEANPALVKSTDSYGHTALYYAPYAKDYFKISQLLIAAGADVNAAGKGGETPLHLASDYCEYDLMELLLEKGANPNARIHDSPYADRIGYTPLHAVLGPLGSMTNDHQQRPAVELLLKYKADPALRTKEGKTPLDVATYYGSTECMRVLSKVTPK